MDHLLSPNPTFGFLIDHGRNRYHISNRSTIVVIMHIIWRLWYDVVSEIKYYLQVTMATFVERCTTSGTCADPANHLCKLMSIKQSVPVVGVEFEADARRSVEIIRYNDRFASTVLRPSLTPATDLTTAAQPDSTRSSKTLSRASLPSPTPTDAYVRCSVREVTRAFSV